MEGQGNNYGATPDALRAQLRITYSDGSSQWIATDSTWKADHSPIVSAEIYNGETYDAPFAAAMGPIRLFGCSVASGSHHSPA